MLPEIPAAPTYRLCTLNGKDIYVKRDDLLPFSFGGNKARKARLFFEDILNSGADSVVTYGSGSSNHCRVVANLAAANGMPCTVISPRESDRDTFNAQLIHGFGAGIRLCPVADVARTIEDELDRMREAGRRPYFIPGGGHGNLGTEAYVRCAEEIAEYESSNGIAFDRIFFASGTGTTQAGLVCGSWLLGRPWRVHGISIARKNPRGGDIVLASVKEYLKEKNVCFDPESIAKAVHFDDRFTDAGYGASSAYAAECIRTVMRSYGLPLDETYTGKAFFAMTQIFAEEIAGGEGRPETVLFVHTGGTPLFFDFLLNQTGR
ncbi:MAG: pyridoxal-phosphate dependent enzyme [Mailhella sp.]|nr:pyridoxal-phosphate dependent enzyme [Mailhella sp.]